MKKAKFLILILLTLTIGCAISGKKDKYPEYFYSDSNDTYLVNLFYDDDTNWDMELLSYMNSSDELLKVMKGIQLYNVEREDNQLRAKRIGVNEFPTILITDDKKVVMETQDIKELKTFFNKLIKKEEDEL